MEKAGDVAMDKEMGTATTMGTDAEMARIC